MLKTASIRNFRNLDIPKIKFSPGYTTLVGENGQGKTNILEAIYLLAYGKPLRGTWGESINWNEDSSSIFAETEGADIKIILHRDQETEFIVNNKPKGATALLGKFLAVFFHPQEIELVVGPPVLRRNFLDRLIATADKEYLFNLLSYHKALRNKNHLLKIRSQEEVQLEVWDKNLASFGQKIWFVREQVVAILNQILRSDSKRVVGSPVFLEYKNPVAGLKAAEAEKRFLKELFAERDLERRYLATIFGPHRDDFKIIMEETRGQNIWQKNLSTFGSRAQQRQAVILLKLAQAKFFNQTFNKKPTLLLDDVASELDESNRDLLLSNLPGGQVLITTTDLELLPSVIRNKAEILTVKDGRILPV